ncbi:hypothetical protein [Streptomyces sp. NPDC004528]|uniref:hypothetical protein n=1 Tax=Streptomyces sp. NPDC004528 TaxID=3154550 RepID=UPI0033B72108
MKIRRWAGRAVTAVAMGGALIGLAGCGDSGKPATGAEAKPAASVQPSVKPADMVKSTEAALALNQLLPGDDVSNCLSEVQCDAAAMRIRDFVRDVQVAIVTEVGSDPYYQGLVDEAGAIMAEADAKQGSAVERRQDVYAKAQALDKKLKAIGLEG